MKKIEDKRVSRTKHSLKNALLTLLKAKDFDQITITDIIKEADYNRGTFYIHYEKKEDLLEDLFEDILADMLTSIRASFVKLESEVNISDLPITTIFDHFLDNKEFYRLILKPSFHHDFREKLVGLIKQHFREDIEFITDGQVDLELLYSFRVHGLIGLILEWVANDFNHSKDYMAEQVVRIASLHTKKVHVKLNSR